MSLTEYQKKRRFSRTPEPKGSVKKAKAARLEFVVQKHQASRLHYDFRLEMDGVLKSWAVPKGPSLDPKDKRLAVMVEDHPYEYRKFEGHIKEGNYGAGDVIVWDKGTYGPAAAGDNPEKELLRQLDKGHISFILMGRKLKGEFSLIKSPHMGEKAWLLVKKKDEYAAADDVLADPGSVLSDKMLKEDTVPAEGILKKVRPMLATLSDEVFDDKDWLYEVKWDGYRAVGAWDGKQAELYSRNGQDFSQKYPSVYEALGGLSQPAVLDGEIVVVDESGRSVFNLLQNYRSRPEGELLYYVFDILWSDGKDLRGLPLVERKRILKDLLPGNGIIRYSDHIEAKGTKFFEAAKANGLEGIMAKKMDSIYKEGFRTKQWLKIKTHMRQEAVIGGFTEPKGTRKHIGALLVGVYEDGRLKYCGHVGGGIPPKQLKPLRERLEKLERPDSPFGEKIRPNSEVHWAKPELVCEVSFGEWTPDGLMRQPIFEGLREDKSPESVVRENPVPAPEKRPPKPKQAGNRPPKPRHFEFTNLDKVFWPEQSITKGDLISYYDKVSRYILPYIKDRPCNLLRHPNGYVGKSFFQKDMAGRVPGWVRTVKIYSESDERNLEYYVCDGKEALLYMVQLGCIEINPWNSRLQSLDNPDWAVIDLDPEGIGFSEVVKVAKAVHEVCEELKVESYPKTSGKTGLHIFMPLGAKYSYEQGRQFAEIIANLVHERTAGITSLERDPKKRQNKIYLDYLQNRPTQTLAAAYSVRPNQSAGASAPLRWDEVKAGLDPAGFNLKTMPARLEKTGDLWKPVLSAGIDLKAVLGRL